MHTKPAKPGSKKEIVLQMLAEGYDVADVSQACSTSRDYVARLAGELGVGVPCEPRYCRKCCHWVTTDPCTTCVLLRRIAAARHALPRSA